MLLQILTNNSNNEYDEERGDNHPILKSEKTDEVAGSIYQKSDKNKYISIELGNSELL